MNMITKKDLKGMFREADERWDKRFNEADERWDKRFNEADERWDKRFANLRKELKDDIETAVAQVIETVMKFTASKEELKQAKEELGGKIDGLSVRMDKVENEVKDVKRSINDLKADLPTPAEFAIHEKRISKLEAVAFPS